MRQRSTRKSIGQAEEARAQPSVSASGTEQPLVLVVDDNRDERDMYAKYLRARGFRVATGADGEQALILAHQSRPAAIVMDLSMPHVDGCEATRRLKRDPLTRDIAVIACTGRVADGAAESALDAGVDAFVTKPCVPRDLLSVVRSVLSKLRARRPGAFAPRPALS
jgi:two-component system, cell cycle response regulator DivK